MPSGGKKGGVPKIPNYYVGIHFVLCHGPIDKITQISIDHRNAWQGNQGQGSLTFDQSNLFGGVSREGGVKGTLDVCLGGLTQTANAYLQAKEVNPISAFRGVCSIILNKFYVGQNYYLKPWSFLATRLHVRHYTGITQWFDAYAEVPSAQIYTYNNNITAPLMSITNVGNLAVVNYSAAHNYTDTGGTNYPLTAGLWVTVSGATDSLYNGTFQIVTNNFTTTQFSYRMNGIPAAAAIGPLRVQQGGVTFFDAALINGVHVLHECLTDPTWGYGYQDAEIDETSWQLAATTCFNEGLGFSWLWTNGSLEEFIKDVLKHINGNIYQSRIDGKFHLNLVRQLTTTTGLFTLNSTNIVAINDFHITSLGNLISSVTVRYEDNATQASATSIPITNLALAARQGFVSEKVINYSGVASLDVAQKLAVRELQAMSTPAYTCSIICNRDAIILNIGDAFLLDRPDYIGSILTMRVITIDLGTVDDGKITIDCVQDIFQSAAVTYITPINTTWVSPISDPIDAPYQLLNEVPYYVVAYLQGDAYAQAVATTSTFFVMAAGAPTQDSMVAGIWCDATGTYVAKGSLDFCATAPLATAVNQTDTSIILGTIINPTYLTIGNFIQIDNELMGIVAVSSNTITVKRGVLDSIPAAHSIGARMFAWDDYFGSDNQTYLLAETIHVKITTTTGKGILPIASATPNTLTMYGRMHRPYPPANLKVNAGYWPTSISLTNLTVTWASRNRFQQTAALVDYYTASITSEVGVTYAYSLDKVSVGVLLSATGLAVLTATLDTLINNAAVTGVTFVGTVATVTTTSAHGLVTGRSVLMSACTGVNASLYNGTFIITVLTTTTFTYTMTGTPTAVPVGTMIVQNSIYAGAVILTVWSINANGISQKVTVPFTLV